MNRWGTSAGVAILVTAALSLVSACGSDTDKAEPAGQSSQSAQNEAIAGGSSDCQKFLGLFKENSDVLTADSSKIKDFANKWESLAQSLQDPNLRTAASDFAQYYDQNSAHKADPRSAKPADSKLVSEAVGMMSACYKR